MRLIPLPRTGPGGPARTEGSAPQFFQNSQNWKSGGIALTNGRSKSQCTEVAAARAWEFESTPCVTAGGLMTACTTLLEVSKVSTDETRIQAGVVPLVVVARLIAGRITWRPPVPLVEEYGAENEKLVRWRRKSLSARREAHCSGCWQGCTKRG
jgi:hypothetical protein